MNPELFTTARFLLLICIHIGYWNILNFVGIEKMLGNFFYQLISLTKSSNYEQIYFCCVTSSKHCKFVIHNFACIALAKLHRDVCIKPITCSAIGLHSVTTLCRQARDDAFVYIV